MSSAQHRTMRAIELCRTAELGGHIDQCDSCGHHIISYNSCRNRHCPKCQSLKKAEWLDARQAELLPVDYFHSVFTLPDSLAAMALQNKQIIYDILFRAAAETLRQIAADPKHLGAEIGFITILHTWGQNLMHHPHIHCLAPGGGLSPEGDCWISSRKNFFLPVRVLSRLFRRLFTEYIRDAYGKGKLHFHGSLQHLEEEQAFSRELALSAKKEWVVYAKSPFGGPSQVLDYLGRYTHRVALSNNRLLNLDNGMLTFAWKDYRHNSRKSTMTLEAEEFIRRFLLHVLPSGFVRIRHYGFLANRHREQKLEQCRKALNVSAPPVPHPEPGDWKARYEALTGQSLTVCPICRKGHMMCIEVVQPHAFSRIKEGGRIDSS
jgi:hypothetical protein